MSWETHANTIRSRWATLIETGEGVPTQYDNGPDITKTPIWARVSVREGESFQAETGATKNYRTPGVLMAQLYDTVEQGDGDLRTLADTVKTSFRSVTVTGVTFRTPSLVYAGRDGNWWQLTVNCPFYFDEVV